jgi:succinate dehydrogenase / fumarate reductase cytochrome b subunit
VEKKRPINLDLTTIKFPCTAIASILHRVSGLLLFLFIPFLLWMLAKSLGSEAGFLGMRENLGHPLAKVTIWLLLASIIYHLLAGIRHILMDIGFAESLQGGRIGAYIVMILAAILSLLAGVWLCC